MAGGLLHLLNHWAIEILVLLSFVLQLLLLLFAGFRRSGASAMQKLVVWPAYQLADFVATFTIGHLSISDDHQLVAFWAPFLLLHLGGPDNITAYSLADNQLWKRQLLFSLVPQVLGAAYVVYKSFDGRTTLLSAALLMFAVGSLKYGERTWALKHANLSSFRSSVNVTAQPLRRLPGRDDGDQELEEEELLLVAHSLFHICRRAVADSSVEPGSGNYDSRIFSYRWKEMSRVAEMELSLMYDLLYTKAAVMRTWFGFGIRVVSPPAVVAALGLFYFHDKSNLGLYRRVDVGITYVLLVSALLLETTSLLRAIGSTWTAADLYTSQWTWLRHEALCKRRWYRVRRAVAFLRRLVNRGGHRWWSGTIGQFNVLHFCTREATGGLRLRDAVAEKIGLGNWWNKRHYSSTIVISEHVKELVFAHIRELLKGADSMSAWELDAIRTTRGEFALRRHRHDDLVSSLGEEFQQGILTWHVATDIYLNVTGERATGKDAAAAARLTEAVRALSNYMLFLLVVRPDMLPGLVLRRLYQVTCDDLAGIWREHQRSTHGGHESSSSRWSINVLIPKLKKLLQLHDDPSSSRLPERKTLARILRDMRLPERKKMHLIYGSAVMTGAQLANDVLLKEKELRMSADYGGGGGGGGDMLRVIFEVWVEMLLYAGNRCSRESHAKQLSRGGELITVVWLLAEHAGLFRIDRTKQYFKRANDDGIV